VSRRAGTAQALATHEVSADLPGDSLQSGAVRTFTSLENVDEFPELSDGL
jgi:hypothetical protein